MVVDPRDRLTRAAQLAAMLWLTLATAPAMTITPPTPTTGTGGLQLLVRTLPVMPAHLYEAELESSLREQGDIVRWYISRVEDDIATAEVVLRPRSSKPRGGKPTMCEREGGSSGSMLACGDHLMRCGDEMVAAAAVLGENQRDEEEPGALSAGGCELVNVGRACTAAAAHLDEGEWGAATYPLDDAAGGLAAAAASLGSHGCGSSLDDGSTALGDAASVTGCMMLAAAAGPSLAACGHALEAASVGLGTYADGLAEGVTTAHAEAGSRLRQASLALRDAGVAMASSGEALEQGRPP